MRIQKYQSPANGIVKQDNTYVAKPIEQTFIKRTYQPRQAYLSQGQQPLKDDSGQLYKNQHLWNWSAPFNNTRLNIHNSKALFDFTKSAGFGTFAIGTALANPIATATSSAGSFIGAGIGNQVAGEKGGFIGGLVGGMLGISPRKPTIKNPKGNTEGIISIHSKMNFDDYEQLIKSLDDEEALYKLYLQNPTVVKRINEVSPTYKEIVDKFIDAKIPKKLGEFGEDNYRAINKAIDDIPEDALDPFYGIPFEYQENIYNIKPGEKTFNKEFVAHEDSHAIDRAMSEYLSTSYLRGLLDPNNKFVFHKWIDNIKDNKPIVDYIKKFSGLDVNNKADYPQIENRVFKYFSDPTEIKAYFSKVPYEKWKKSVDRSYDGKIINNPVSEEIFQITDADIMNDIRLQLIASIYGRKSNSYEALKNSLSNKIWGISTISIPFLNTLQNNHE